VHLPAGPRRHARGWNQEPDVERIIALGPDLVIANEEENREPDLAALRSTRVAVWVTGIRDLTQALRLSRELGLG